MPAEASCLGNVLFSMADPFEFLPALRVEPAQACAYRVQTGRPFVTLSYAQSLDGSITDRPGKPLALSGELSLVLTHHLRAGHAAILVGIGTVLADNPRLTVRLVPARNPQPVVVDSHLRFPLDASLLRSSCPWIATTDQADAKRQQMLEAAGARVLRLPVDSDGQVDLSALLRRLGELGVNSLLVEGGARIITGFLQARLVDRLVLTIAPVMVGGLNAVGKLMCCARLGNVHHASLGQDLILWGDVETV